MSGVIGPFVTNTQMQLMFIMGMQLLMISIKKLLSNREYLTVQKEYTAECMSDVTIEMLFGNLRAIAWDTVMGMARLICLMLH